ncbi:protein YgfX [Denitromonas sp.]|uniref:protein YgfX n=1 Tax=Denitromonas sp. TaxID=2734609 RepID=UPI002AFE281F|nr:protein YgfX [Denitromonas sp.]
MAEAVFRLPLTLELKPSRRLHHLAMAAAVGTALVFALTPGIGIVLRAAGGLAALLLFWRAGRRRSGGTLTLLPDAQWIAPGQDEACALAASSVDLFGVLWLHGRCPDGRRLALMVMPDALVHPEGWRWLCVWFRNAPGEAALATDTTRR